MNNKGFTLIELLTVLIVMSFVMIMIAPSIMDLLDSNNNKKYVNYENVIKELAIASDYKDSEFIYICDLDNVNSVVKSCKGYVHNDGTNYKTYLYCDGGKYITDNTDYTNYQSRYKICS